MYVNGKMRPVETISGMGVREIKRMMKGMNSDIIYLLYCKNFYKCHNVQIMYVILFFKRFVQKMSIT
jgi:hypothetical protein